MAGVRFLVAGAVLYAWSRIVEWRGGAGPRAVACDGRRRCAAPARRQRPASSGPSSAFRPGLRRCSSARCRASWCCSIGCGRAARGRPGASSRGSLLGLLGSRLARRPRLRSWAAGAPIFVGAAAVVLGVVLVGARLDLLAARADAGLAVPVDGDADARGRRRRCSRSASRSASRGAFDAGAVSLRSLLGLLYLVVFGSIVAFSAYVWLLRVSTPARVSTYAYVNPVVAVLLGCGVRGRSVDGARWSSRPPSSSAASRSSRWRRGGLSRYPCRAL